MYTCGPTVYRYAHVGNLRSYLLADLIRRALLYHGLEVLHVKNITDVGHLRDERFDRGEDRMLVQAGLECKTPAEIADAYEAAFHADEALVNILPAHVFPRATEHIPEMIALAERLEDAGYAYATTRATSTTRSRLPGLRAAVRQHASTSCGPAIAARSSRTSATRPTSRSGRRPARAGSLKWPTRALGRGLPGLAPRVLGDGDALPRRRGSTSTPAASTTSSPTTRTRSPSRRRSSAGRRRAIWVHGEHLLMAGRKMAKSAGNFQRITELVERRHRPARLPLPRA